MPLHHLSGPVPYVHVVENVLRENAIARAEELLLDTCKDLTHLRKIPVQWFVDLGIKEGIAEEVREESKILARRIRFIEANDSRICMRFLSYKFGFT